MKVVDYKNENLATVGGRATAAILDVVFLTIIVLIIHFTCGTWARIIELLTALHYDLGMHILRGATLGQSLLNIQVVSLDGGKVGLWQNIVRYFSKGFSALPLGIGFFLAARDARRMAWHDKIAGTCVVIKDAAPVGTTEIDRTSLVKTGLFLGLTGALVLAVTGVILLSLNLLSNSPSYEPAKTTILEQPVIADSVGTIVESRMISFRVGHGPLGTAGWYLTSVKGSRASATIATTVVKKGDSWQLQYIGFRDNNGNVISLRRWTKDRAAGLASAGDRCYDAQLLDSAFELYSRAIEYDSGCATAWYGRCGVYFNRGRYRDAIADGTQAVLLNPKDRPARYRLGICHQEAGFYREALRDFERLLRLDLTDKRAFLGKARALDSLGRSQEALLNYEEFLRLAQPRDSIFISAAKYRVSVLRASR